VATPHLRNIFIFPETQKPAPYFRSSAAPWLVRPLDFWFPPNELPRGSHASRGNCPHYPKSKPARVAPGRRAMFKP